MFFRRMREKMKLVIVIVIVAMAGGLVWAGVSGLFGGQEVTYTEAATVVATVNGQGIPQYALHQTFINQLQQLEQQQGVLPGRAYELVRFQALDTLIGSVVISQEIANRNLAASKAEIDAEMQRIIDLFPSKDDFETQLSMMGMTESMLRDQVSDEIKFDKLQIEIIGDHPVSEQEIIEAYEQVRTSHILFVPEDDGDEAWALAEERAWDVYGQVNTENFAELAQTYSADTSSERGGDIGFAFRGQTVPEYEEVAFALQVGEISEPVRSQFGYHIITVTERRDAEGDEFAEARPAIEDMLRREKGQDDLMAWFEDVRSEADVVYLDHHMSAVASMQAEDYEDAVHYYKLAIEEQPNDGYLYASLGDVYRALEDIDEAIAQYKQATELYTTDHLLWISLGDLYAEHEYVDEAVEAYLKASELVPNDILTQLSLYYSVSGLEREEEALIIEERIEAFQEMQNELLKEQQATAEETEEIEEETDPDGADVEELEAEPAEESTPEN